MLEGILWILHSDARWQDLPEEYASPSTCWRGLKPREGQGVQLDIWRAFVARWMSGASWNAAKRLPRGASPQPDKGARVGTANRGKPPMWMVVVDGQSLPLGNLLEAASPAEAIHLESTSNNIVYRSPPRKHAASRLQRLILSNRYDRDPFRGRYVNSHHVGLVVPPEEPAALAEAIRRLKQDWHEAERLGWNERRIVEEQFGRRQVLKRFAEHLEVLARRS